MITCVFWRGRRGTLKRVMWYFEEGCVVLWCVFVSLAVSLRIVMWSIYNVFNLWSWFNPDKICVLENYNSFYWFWQVLENNNVSRYHIPCREILCGGSFTTIKNENMHYLRVHVKRRYFGLFQNTFHWCNATKFIIQLMYLVCVKKCDRCFQYWGNINVS